MCERHKNIKHAGNVFWMIINGTVVAITHCPWCGKELRKHARS